MGIVGKHFGDIPSRPKSPRMRPTWQLSPIRWYARPRDGRRNAGMRGRGYPIGLGDAKEPTGRTPKNQINGPIDAEDRERPKSDRCGPGRVESKMESGPVAVATAAAGHGRIAQMRAYLRGRRSAAAMGRPRPDEDRPGDPGPSQRLGRPPTDDEVLQALQRNPMSATLNFYWAATVTESGITARSAR